jgi:predicted transcriptional regulator
MSYALDNLRTERMNAGHSISSLAHLANISDVAIKTLEDGGAVDEALCQRIADVLGVSLATLGGREL